MNDIDHMPKRLVEEADDAFLRSVLHSAKADKPSAGARDALLASLGAGLGIAGATAGAETAAHGASAFSNMGARFGGSAAAKWFVLVSVGAAAVVSALSLGRQTDVQAEAFQRVTPVSAPQGWPKAEPVLEAKPVAPSENVTDKVTTRAVAEAPSKVHKVANDLPTPVTAESKVAEATHPAAADTVSSAAPIDAHRLSEELKVLEAARLASKRGDQAAAIAALDKHAEDREGVLKVEELVLRVQTLAKAGDRRGALAAFRALETAGASPGHLARARAAISAMPAE